MDITEQVQGAKLNLSSKPKGPQLRRFVDLLVECDHTTKHCSTPKEAFDIIFGEKAVNLLGFTKGYVGAVDITEDSAEIAYLISPERWRLDGDKEIIERYAGIKRPVLTGQGRLMRYILEHKNSYITSDFKRDINISPALQESISLNSVIVSPLLILNEVVGYVLLGYPEYPSVNIQWMHEHFISYSALPIMQSFWLKRYREEIERTTKWKVLGQQASALAHSLKTPIGTLHNCLSLLDSQEGLDKTTIRIAETQVKRIRSTTANLLSFVREAHMNIVRVRVRDLIEDSIDSSVSEAKEASISGNALDKTILLDVEKMILVLRNLIDNAYQSPESPTSNKSRRVEIRADGDDHELTISVSDNGEGFTEKAARKHLVDKKILTSNELNRMNEKELVELFMKAIFSPFFSSKKQGHGLGLAVAQKFVNDHGGRMQARNRESGGARIEVILPWQPQETERVSKNV